MSSNIETRRRKRAEQERRRRARRALEEGRTYKPRKFTRGLPRGVDLSLLSTLDPNETSAERRKRRARERYVKERERLGAAYHPANEPTVDANKRSLKLIAEKLRRMREKEESDG